MISHSSAEPKIHASAKTFERHLTRTTTGKGCYDLNDHVKISVF